MKLFTKYNRINTVIMVTFFLLSGLTYYFLMNYLILKELDQRLGKIETQVRNYTEKYKMFPQRPSLGDLRVNYTQADTTTTFREFKSIDPPGLPGNHPHRMRELSFSLQLDHKWFKVTISKNLEGVNS